MLNWHEQRKKQPQPNGNLILAILLTALPTMGAFPRSQRKFLLIKHMQVGK